MFTSLDRVDIELKPEPSGQKRFLQTDHRTAVEIEQTPELSVLFALTRILNPRRLVEAGSPAPIVIYSALEPPPEFLRRAIRAAGGELMIGDDKQLVADDTEPPTLSEVMTTPFAAMASAVANECQVTLTLDGLQTVELALANACGDPEEDEQAYWSAVMKLGSFGGELIRASNGGEWRVTDTGTLPFALFTPFRGEEAKINPLGKAIKRFANGEEDSLVHLAHLIRSQP